MSRELPVAPRRKQAFGRPSFYLKNTYKMPPWLKNIESTGY